MKNKLFLIIMAMLLVMSFVTGCGQQPAKDVEETPEPTAAIKVLGEEKDGSAIVELTNKTGKEISEIYVKTSDTKGDQQNLLAENETIALNETFNLVFNSVGDEVKASGTDGLQAPLHVQSHPCLLESRQSSVLNVEKRC